MTLLRLLSLALVAVSLFGQNRPPNVVLLFSDDQGTIDVNAYGAEDLHTPNLNRLARQGVRFTQLYVGAPVCSPSRASLLTGRTPHWAGVPGNVPIHGKGLPSEQVTMAEVLKEAGYETALIGKWHLGSVDGNGPRDQGFSRFFGHMRGCIDNFSHFFYWNGPNVHDLWDNGRERYRMGEYFPDMMVSEAKDFIYENRDKPFFLYMPFNIPHYPLQGTDMWRDYYFNRIERTLAENRRHYAALVSTLDERVGQVLDFLDSTGLAENTLVVFLSDHGHSTEERAMFGGGSAGPYRGAKFSLFEGGIRVPAIMRLPEVIPADAVREQMVSSMDILPTVAELTGATLPAGHEIDGKSLTPVIEDPNAPSQHEALYWQLGDQWAVRAAEWKLVVNARDTDRSLVEGEESGGWSPQHVKKLLDVMHVFTDDTIRRTEGADTHFLDNSLPVLQIRMKSYWIR